MNNRSSDSHSRRSVLKRAGALSTAGSIAVLSGAASAETKADSTENDVWTQDYPDDPVWTDEYHDEAVGVMFDTEYLLEHALAVEYYGDTIFDGHTTHKYRVASSSVGRMEDEDGGWEDPDSPSDVGNGVIEDHSLSIDASTGEISLWDSDDPRYLGAFPVFDEESSPDYAAAAETVITAAVGAISPKAGTLITGAQILDSLLNENDPGGAANTRDFEWSYGLSEVVDQATHYYEFYIRDYDICRSDSIPFTSTASSAPCGEIELSGNINVPMVADPGVCW